MTFNELGAYQFCSRTADEKVGSIYFQHGRMRIQHDAGPANIKTEKDISFYTLHTQAQEFRDAFRHQGMDQLDAALGRIIELTGITDSIETLRLGFNSGNHYHIKNGLHGKDIRFTELYTHSADELLHVHYSRGIAFVIDLAPHMDQIEELFDVIEADGDVAAYLANYADLRTALGF